MDETIWNALHNGNITAIQGRPPGNVSITIEVADLRKLWGESGSAIVIQLKGCNTLAWNSYDTPPDDVTDNIALVEDIQPFILQTQFDDEQGLLTVATESGDLIMHYTISTITLDTGTPVTPEELKHKSDLFWDNY